jgi:hypothetical protein
MATGRATSSTLQPGTAKHKGPIRYTDIFVTVNTNQKPYSKAEESALYEELERLITDVMFTDDEIKKILPMADPDAIEEVIMTNLSLETGQRPRGGRVHAHFILNIAHRTNFELFRANSSFNAWYNAHISWYTGRNGVNCLVILLNSSKVKNYIAKTGRAPPRQIMGDFS